MGKKHKQEETVQVKDEGSTECRVGKKHKKQKVKEDAGITTEDPGALPLSACSVRTEKKKKRKRKGDSEDSMDSLAAKTRKLAEELLNGTLDTSTTSQEPQQDGSATVELDQETKMRKKKKKRLSEDAALPSPAEGSAVKASEKDQEEDEKEADGVSEAGRKSSMKKERKGHGLAEQLHEDADAVKSEKKKKKCKKSKHSENCEHDVENGFNGGVAEPVEKKKKRKNKMVFDGSKDGDISSVNCSTGDLVVDHTKKKQKDAEAEDTSIRQSSEASVRGNSSERLGATQVTTKNKLKKNKSEMEASESQNENIEQKPSEGEHVNGDGTKKAKRKKDKKKKKRDEREGSASEEQSETLEDPSEPAAQAKHKDRKKKSKEAPHANRSVADTQLALPQNGSEEAGKMMKKKKDKKKKQAEEEATEDSVVSGDCGDVGKEVDTKKTSKKKKEKKSEKVSGNEDPSTPDSSAANSKTPPEEQQSAHTETQQAQSACLGQWSTNMFKSTERQNKFLRLLGGFKKAGGEGTDSQKKGLFGSLQAKADSSFGGQKGLFGSLQAKADSNVGGQKALSYQGARDMNRRLESDFERALSFRAKGQRGVGLGFTPDPAEGKKFHIDINKTASTKFH